MIKKILLLVLAFNFLHADSLGITQKLGNNVSLDLKFIKENSKEVTLRELMDGKPTLLTLNYFKCAGICTPQLNDMAKMLSRVHLAENTDYKVITVDFAEDETTTLAKSKRKTILQSMSRSYVKDAWHFVIGKDGSSKVLAQSVGFEYKKVLNAHGEVGYIHAALLVVISPKGKITRYLEGIEQLPADITMALREASNETVRPSIAKNSPYCFTQTPQADEYMSVGGKIWAVFSLLVLGIFLMYLLKISKRNKEE